MALLLTEKPEPRLERSCGAAGGDWLRIAPLAPGIERMEACFAGHAFGPHRHDTYAIGYTRQGVQSFGYRGTVEHSLAGQCFVLHPDETHDGRAGTESGFRYRILYVAPALVRDALCVTQGDRRSPLPFLRAPVSRDRRLAAAIVPALADLDRPLEDLQRDQLLADLAEALAAADPSAGRPPLAAAHVRAVDAARDFLHVTCARPITSGELEAVTGLSRYVLARHFRRCLGTSPYRYLTLRRLDRVRALIREGAPLAEAAVAAGFADQSHMTRQFGRAYGISPGRWAAMLRSRPN